MMFPQMLHSEANGAVGFATLCHCSKYFYPHVNVLI